MKERLSLKFPSLVFEGGEGASNAEIAKAEGVLGVVFPADFSDYLRSFGWLEVSHYELFGLGSNAPHFLDLLKMAPSEWADFGLKKHLLPFWNNGGGDLHCVDLKASTPSESVVVLFPHETREEEFEIRGFENWLVERLAAAAEEDDEEA